MTTVSMRMAKATDADQEGAMELYKFLNAISSGYLPPENEDEEEWRRFDHHSNQDLALFYTSMMEVFSSGGLMRVLMAAHAMLNQNNKLVDPDKDYLEFHPRIEQMQQQRDELLTGLKLAFQHVDPTTHCNDHAQIEALIAKAEVAHG